MKKKIKFIVLFIFLAFVLSGCGWEDVQKEYGEILKNNVSCSYNLSTGNTDLYGVKKIEFSADYDGAYINFNSGSKNTIANKNGVKDSVTINGYKLDMSVFLENLLKSYGENNTCPQMIYIDTYHNRFIMDKTTAMENNYLTYSLGKTTTTNQNGEVQDCHHSGNNVSCGKYTKKVGENTNQYYIEIGSYTINNVEKKYLMISSYDDFRDGAIAEEGTGENGGLSMRYDDILFAVPANAINELWLKDNKYISSSNMKITYDFFANKYCYITGPNSIPSDNVSTTRPGEDVEDGPTVDSEPSKSDVNSNKNIQNVNDIVLCETPRVLKVFQILGYILFIVKIVIPLILIILATIDFAKAVTSSDEKADKEVLRKLVNRVIIAVAIFLIPTVLDVGFSLVDGAAETTSQFSKCSSCLFDPYNSCQNAGLDNSSNQSGTSGYITGTCTCVDGNNPKKSQTFSCAEKSLKDRTACDSYCEKYYRGVGGYASINTCQNNY